MEEKIGQYYSLIKMRAFIDKKLEALNKEIKETLEPGQYQVGKFKVNIDIKRKFELDEGWLRLMYPNVWVLCLEEVLDKDLVESAYLRGEISDEDMKKIRGDAKIITSLRVDKVEDECTKEVTT